MSNISLDFQQAKVKHLQFKSNLRSILYGASNIDENPILSHYECTVGKWIYDYALGKYGYLPEMLALEDVHADIHKKAKELVNLYKHGDVLEARNGLTEMEQIADKLVNLLALIEIKIKTSQDKFLDSDDYQLPQKTIAELQELTKTNEDLDKIISRQTAELTHERQMLKDIFMELPAMIAILKGNDFKVEMANSPFKELLQSPVVEGLPIRTIFPELAEQGFMEVLEKVYSTGEPITKKIAEFIVKKPSNKLLKMKIELSLIPLKNADGITEGIISFSYDVTNLINY